MPDQLFDKDHDPHLLATGKITMADGRQRVRLTFNRLVLSGQQADLIRDGDCWELRLDVGERYGCNHLAPYDALCWECQDATYEREDSK